MRQVTYCVPAFRRAQGFEIMIIHESNCEFHNRNFRKPDENHEPMFLIIYYTVIVAYPFINLVRENIYMGKHV